MLKKFIQRILEKTLVEKYQNNMNEWITSLEQFLFTVFHFKTSSLF